MTKAQLMKLVSKIDLAVERADYGGEKQDKELCNLMTDEWPNIEPILRRAAEAGIH